MSSVSEENVNESNFSDRSTISVTESEPNINQHRYFTRSSVKHLTVSSPRQRGICNVRENRISVFKPPPRPVRSMDWQGDLVCNNNNRRVYKYISLILISGILSASAWYIYSQFEKTQNTFKDVKNDLLRIHHQMDSIKLEVANVIKSREETTKKLDDLFNVLEDIKTMAGGASSQTPKSCTPERKGDIQKYVSEAFDRYNADRTGKTDFALESAGGSIIHTRNTVTYNPYGGRSYLFGFSICPSVNGPNTMIQTGMMPGECWAFQGSSGTAIIKLLGRIFVTGVSLEHISKAISPTGCIDTAPKEFSIWGLGDPYENEGFFLGQFFYDINGPPLQYYDISNCQSAYRFIEFKVHSNHGHPDFTCVYRLRVHGNLESRRL